MPSYPSDPFFESGAMACLIFYRTNGLHGSITCLHNMIRPYLPVVRINAILISKDFRIDKINAFTILLSLAAGKCLLVICIQTVRHQI